MANLISIGNNIVNLDQVTAIDVVAGVAKILTRSSEPVIQIRLGVGEETKLLGLVPNDRRFRGSD